MYIKRNKGPAFVSVPGVGKISRSELPPPDTRRWVASRKAAVVKAVVSGLITMEEACERYALSEEEYLGWQAVVEKHGFRALKATDVQKYRQP